MKIELGDNSVDKIFISQARGSEFDSSEKPGVVATTCDLSTEEVDREGSLELAGHEPT